MVGNRDEFHDRPTAPLHIWPDPPISLMAGRDLRSGGSWMGLAGNGRAAVVTNVRDPLATTAGPSRGQLIADFLAGTATASGYMQALADRASAFAPFNLVVADAESCHYLGNHPAAAQSLAPGIHGMSNGALDAPWPKTRRLTARLEHWLQQEATDLEVIWQALADETHPADAELPDTGIPLDLERRLSGAFIRGDAYGTRASTVVAIDHAGSGFIHERRFGPNGVATGETRLEIGVG